MRRTEHINITLPIGVAARAKEMGLNLSGTLLYAIKTKIPKKEFKKLMLQTPETKKQKRGKR